MPPGSDRKIVERVTEYFGIMRNSMTKMVEASQFIAEVCDPDLYYKHVRPWIFSLKNIRYEGVRRCGIFPGWFWRLRGETGAQSPAIPSFDAFLGIQHKISGLTIHIRAMRRYRPPEQNQWLDAIRRGPSLREFVKEHTDNDRLKNAFNDVHDALYEFRRMHKRLAETYILAKDRGTTGTGGTHLIKFLSWLMQSTLDHKIK